MAAPCTQAPCTQNCYCKAVQPLPQHDHWHACQTAAVGGRLKAIVTELDCLALLYCVVLRTS